ncbi:AAA family ATPase [Nostoc sp. CHAB 5834]|nr:AAA family ATPase [Nostoc sp. CHAB 5834]
MQQLNSNNTTSFPLKSVANIEPLLPTLWVTNIITARSFKPLFTIRCLSSSNQGISKGNHYIIADKATSEADIKAVGWMVQQARGDCFVHRINLPLDCLVSDATAARELTQEIFEFALPFADWIEIADERKLKKREALTIAKVALALLPENEQDIELDQLGERCGASDWEWRKKCEKLASQAQSQQTNQDKLRLELQALAKEADPIAKAFIKQKLAESYRIRLSEIDNLLKHISEQGRIQEVKCYSLDELLDLNLPSVDYVIPGMLPQGETILLVADPKSGKSLIAYDAAFAVATGEDTFLGEKCKQGKVLIIQCDESPTTARGRLLKRGFRREDASNVEFMDSFNITQLHLLEAKLETFRPTLVIIDSLKRITVGSQLSENSAEFADNIYRLKEIISRYNASGILIHHANKNIDAVGVGRVRGNSSIAGATWGIWSLEHIPEPDPNNPKRFRVNPKSLTRIFNILARDTEGQTLKIELDPEINHWVSLGQDGITPEQKQSEKSQQERIVELLQSYSPKGLEASDISQHLGIAKKSIYTQLNRLVEKRIIGTRPSVTDRRRSVYYITQPKNDNPPSLPLYVPDVIQSAEINTTQCFQSSITDSQQIDNRYITDTRLSEGIIENSLCPVSISEIDNNIQHTQGGGGVKTISELLPETPVHSVTQPEFMEGDKITFHEGDNKWKPGTIAKVVYMDAYFVSAEISYFAFKKNRVFTLCRADWMKLAGKVNDQSRKDQ